MFRSTSVILPTRQFSAPPDEGVDLLEPLPHAADRLRVVARIRGRIGGEREQGMASSGQPECVHHEEGLENLLRDSLRTGASLSPGPPAHILRRRLTISSADWPPRLLVPRLRAGRSIACSTVSVVRTPNETGSRLERHLGDSLVTSALR